MKYNKVPLFLKFLPFILIMALGGIYLKYTWNRIEKQASSNILQIAKSVEATLPKDGLDGLQGAPPDIQKDYYQLLKNTLGKVIEVNDRARFAYLYKASGNDIVFLADSEPVDSEDYSPPGQILTEATPTDWLPLKDGKDIVTKPLTDRWGTWVSTLIPIKDPKTGKPVAVFGMDFDARSYKAQLLVEEMRSTAIIVMLLLLFLFLFRIREKNETLKDEIQTRINAEKVIQQQNLELIQLNTTKDKFFSIIAHDLRGPFAGFLGLTEMLAQTLHSMTLDEIQLFAKSMEKSSKNLYRLLENLLQWSLLQRNVMSFNPMETELELQVEEAVSIVNETYNNKGIRLLVEIPANLKVFADASMLNGILRNLLSNACKYTEKGGAVTIKAQLTRENLVQISISDTGIGMSQELAANLFRLDVVTGRKGTQGEPSTGLGLILCRDFIEKHGGRLWVESTEGKGTTFFFTMQANQGIVRDTRSLAA